MRELWIVVAGVIVVVAAIDACRRRRERQAADVIDRAIEANRFRYVKGMSRMDEPLRDRTAARRREREEALQMFTRELRDERPRLHRAS